jgi:hypothetical protein
MQCTKVTVNGVTAIVCGARRRRSRCAIVGCNNWSVALCDWPLPPNRKGKVSTCDRDLCPAHALHVSIAEDRDHCPEHAREGLRDRWKALPESLKTEDVRASAHAARDDLGKLLALVKSLEEAADAAIPY